MAMQEGRVEVIESGSQAQEDGVPVRLVCMELASMVLALYSSVSSVRSCANRQRCASQRHQLPECSGVRQDGLLLVY